MPPLRVSDRLAGSVADDGRPLAHAPRSDQTVQHVRIVLREASDDGIALRAKEEYRPVDWFREGARQNELAATVRGTREIQVLAAVLRSPLEVVGSQVVEQQVVVHAPTLTRVGTERHAVPAEFTRVLGRPLRHAGCSGPASNHMRLPTKLAFTAFHVAVAGTIACAAKTDHGTPAGDAAPDVPMEAAADVTADVAEAATNDAPMQDVVPMEASIVDAATDVPTEGGDECAANYYCGQATPDASCPGPVCDLSECPLDAGCEPFV